MVQRNTEYVQASADYGHKGVFVYSKLYKGLGSKSDSTIGCELLVQPGVVEAHISIHAILSGLKQNQNA